MRAGYRLVTVAGGTLYRVAAQYLGSATQWNRVAEASGLTDPQINGVVTLIIPPRDQGAENGGILGQP